MNSLLLSSTRCSSVRSRNAYTIPFGLSTATIDSQSSRPSISTGTVTGRALAPSTATAISAATARPPGKDVRDRRAEDALAVEAGDALRGTVPEPDEARVVEQEDAVADRLEHLRRVLALGRDRTRSRLGLGELLALHLGANACRGLRLRRLVQPRVPHRRAELADQPFDEVQVLAAL